MTEAGNRQGVLDTNAKGFGSFAHAGRSGKDATRAAGQAWTERCSHAGCRAAGAIGFRRARFCSTDCLRPALRTALDTERRQARLGSAISGPRPEGRNPIGRILVEQGAVTEQQLAQALCSQREAGAGRLGSWLRQQAGLSEADLAAALGIQWHCPVFRVGTLDAARMASYLPRQLMESCSAIPLRVAGSPGRLALCFEDHVDASLVQAVTRMHGMAVDAGLLTATGYWQAMRELLAVPLFGAEEAEERTSKSIEDTLEIVTRFTADQAARSLRVVAVHDRFWVRVLVGEPAAKAEYRNLLCTLPTAVQ